MKPHITQSTYTWVMVCFLFGLFIGGTPVRTVDGSVWSGDDQISSETISNPVLRWFHAQGSIRPMSDTPDPLFCAPPENGSDTSGGKRERARRRKERKAQIKRLVQKYVPNGNVSILKPGAIKGNRTMDDPWTVETNHYIVKTDISRKAAGEIALIMEMFYNAMVRSTIFNIEQVSHEKLPVLVPKNRSEFIEIVSSKGHEPSSSLKAFYHEESENKEIVTYYIQSEDLNVQNFLLGLGTKQLIDVAMNSEVPAWLKAGFIRYVDTSRFKGWQLQMGWINKERLRTVRENLKWEVRGGEKTVEDLATLMRKDAEDFSGDEFDQAWSLVHFLIHWKNGKLAGKLRKYFEYYKRENITKDPVQLFQETFGFHPEKMRKYWRKYVFRIH